MYSAYSKTKTWKVKPYYSIKKKKGHYCDGFYFSSIE
jgi:hypothetical protein